MVRVCGRAALLPLVLLLVVGMCAALPSSPAAAARKRNVGSHALPKVPGTCVYSGDRLVGLRVARPRAAMNKRWARSFRSQWVGVSTALQGWNGKRWVKVKAKPAKKRHAKRATPVLTKVPRGKSKLVPARHRTVLAYGARDLRRGYSAFRVKLTLSWYRPNSSSWRPEGRWSTVVSRWHRKGAVAASCVRQLTPVVRSVSVGDSHACAVMSDATLRCWGNGDTGRIGPTSAPAQTCSARPCYLRPVTVTGLTGVRLVVASYGSTCALVGTALKCWGMNSYGQLGDGTTTDRATPATVPVAGPTGIFTYQTSCATATGQQLRCWGRGEAGQMGDKSTTTAVTQPKVVNGATGVLQVGSGNTHVCTLDTAGSVYCWGKNAHGQLGVAADDTVHSRALVAGLGRVSRLVSGGSHNCAIVAGGEVRCWGYGTLGSLGDGRKVDSATPVTVAGLSGVTALSAEADNACAIMGGRAYCWGSNNYGQAGSGLAVGTNASTPQPVKGLTGLTGIDVGGRQVCAWNAAGRVWCWGEGTFGALGNGSTRTSLTPVAVVGL